MVISYFILVPVIRAAPRATSTTRVNSSWTWLTLGARTSYLMTAWLWTTLGAVPPGSE